MFIFPIFDTKVYSADNTDALKAANELHELGLFNGTGINMDGSPIYDLDGDCTRNQAIIMLVRLLGKEKVAKANLWYIPFTDVEVFSTSYYCIGYGYNHSLTNGVSDEKFGGTSKIQSNQYIAFVLRALGYKSPDDFTVSKSYEFATSIGLIKAGEYVDKTARFTRGDVAIISRAALDLKTKEGNTLRERIEEINKINSEALYRQVDVVQYSSFNEALRMALKRPEGVAIPEFMEKHMENLTIIQYSYDYYGKESFGLFVIYKDGRFVRLPLPEGNTGLRSQPIGVYYNESYNYISYESDTLMYVYYIDSMTSSVNRSFDER